MKGSADLRFSSALARTMARATGSPVRFINRAPLIADRTFPSERVTCIVPGGRRLHVLCKHGARRAEYSPRNILVMRGRVYPVDWESTALTAGEIDLAALVDLWPADVTRAYIRACWPQGPPADFERVFAAAQLYQQFRWLDDRPAWTRDPVISLKRFAYLGAAGERLGAI